jgi:CheY-like chemotaxis protein
MTLSTLLAIEGYEVIHVPSGEDAIEKVNALAETISPILMDILLGQGLDGAQAAQCIP